MIDKYIEQLKDQSYIQEILKSTSYYLEYLNEAKDRFLKFSIPDIELEELITKIDQWDGSDFMSFIERHEKSPKRLLELTGELISYLDKKAANKNHWNKYEDKRVLAESNVRQPYWVNHLLRYKKDAHHKASNNIRNAILYLENPLQHLTILSLQHRKQISEHILKEPYSPQTFTSCIFKYFEKFELQTKEPSNYTYLLGCVLYNKDVRRYWDIEQEEKSIKMTDIFEKYKVYLDDFRQDLTTGSRRAYVESSKHFIPDYWDKTYEEEFKNLDYNNFNLKRLDSLISPRSFKGKWSFEGFLTKELESFKSDTSLNQILYGPPGTGKTYRTKELAVDIILGKNQRTREEVLQCYEELQEQQQIVFTTFHQSMSYEDFVEGIKPEINEDGQVTYEVQSGIFKEICSKAKGILGAPIKHSDIDFNKVSYYKMSLGGKNRKEVHDWCIKNKKIALGYGDNVDHSDYLKIKSWEKFRDMFSAQYPYMADDSSNYIIQVIFAFQNMKIGDLVVISLGNQIIDAVGVITGEYEYDPDNKFGFHHLRDVRWLGEELRASPDVFLDKAISQRTIYKFDKQDVKIESFINYFQSQEKIPSSLEYVLIIDEINRGNISSIFGELITLLEDDKRIGRVEETSVVLPYSKESFSVPKNVHIIGTMNTADRSVEALDTALRRRFSFIETPPNPDILLEAHPSKGVVEDTIDLISLLKTINTRILMLKDKDHMIGHSYFIKANTIKELINLFSDKIIPLLEEYFFMDMSKIGLILGSSFVKKISPDIQIGFADFEDENQNGFIDQSLYEIVPKSQWTSASFISIYKRSS